MSSTTTTSASASSGTVTTTLTIGNTAATRPQTLVLQLNRKPKKKVSWMPGTVDNEFMQKKSSKKCCIFHKEKPFDEDDSDDDQDHHNHCHDHNPDAASCSSSKPSD